MRVKVLLKGHESVSIVTNVSITDNDFVFVFKNSMYPEAALDAHHVAKGLLVRFIFTRKGLILSNAD